MKKFFAACLCVLSLSIAMAQVPAEFLLEGNYGDFKQFHPQTHQPHEFTFVRLMYQGRIPGYIKNWYTDLPTGDRNLVEILKRSTGIDVAPEPRVVPAFSPDLFNYPFVYSSEAGQMVLDDIDARMLREYLNRGGFWMIDDFWGTFEWENFEREMKKVFPDRPIKNIPVTHPFFHCFHDIDEVMQVPNIGYAYTTNPVTWEQDGEVPYTRGIFDDHGRLMVFINYNTDLMDASEWADDPKYPHQFSAYAYRVFENAVVYALTH